MLSSIHDNQGSAYGRNLAEGNHRRISGPMISRILLIVVLCTMAVAAAGAQTGDRRARSLALKDPPASHGLIHVPPDNSAEEMWDEFLLVQHANSGDPVAEHQLGLRYLLGKGFFADTVRAAEWIGKAARKNLLTARYNYGILLNNGWGVRWNPFEAFSNIRYAARKGLTDAEYVYGLFFAENLVVPRNIDSAVRWIRAAADSGFAPAVQTLAEMKHRGIHQAEGKEGKDSGTTQAASTPQSYLQPIFLDFSTDSLPPVHDSTLLREALMTAHGGKEEPDSGTIDSTLTADVLQQLRAAADEGSPEALTMLGRIFERGRGVPRDAIEAAAYYLRAARFDSPRAPAFLWEIVRDDRFFVLLKERVDHGSAAAEFLWSGLVDLGFDNHLTDQQALAMLEDAARQNYPDAVVQLALCYYTGKWVKKDQRRGAELLERARRLGSNEADIRICLTTLHQGERDPDAEACIYRLAQHSGKGSLLAQSTLGYCYEQGLGVSADTSKAVSILRQSAERGSKIAFGELRDLYDALRPAETEFQLYPGESAGKKD